MSSNRRTYYPSQIPLETQIMEQERDTAKSLWQFVLDALGSNGTVFSGLAATPGTGLTVQIGAGSLYQYGEIDPTTWSSMSADTSQWMLQAILASAQVLSGFNPPSTAGQSISYLVEAQLQVVDDTAVSMPFSDGATPPNTVYQMHSPARINEIAFRVVAGAAATTGTQTPPSPDAGWTPLYVVSVANGETQIATGDIALAANAPQFFGFVHTNPNGNTPVFLSPLAQQSGGINISGKAQVGTIQATAALLGGASATTNFDGTWKNGFAGDYLSLTAVGYTGSKQTTDSLDIAGSIGYSGTHAGTDADPYPLSQLNVAMLGGKLASDYALASGHYIILYTGAPTADPTNLNAAIGGYFMINVATGTAPLQVTSTTMCPNLNAQFLGGFAAGNAANEIPVSNGTLCTDLNAQFLGGLPASAFQPAGSYATMNVNNTGTFTATGEIASTGGTGTSQVAMGYAATNGSGINGGGPMAFLESFVAPLALLGPSVRTDGPLYVGDENPQPVVCGDVEPSGMIRSGMCAYRVTRSAAYSSTPVPLIPGTGYTDYGVWPTMGGALSAPTMSGMAETISFRTVVTLTSPITAVFNIRANDAVSIYVDGVQKFVANNASALDCTASISIGAGTHTIDITYSADGQPGAGGAYDDHFLLFPWIPFVAGAVAPQIVSCVPG